MSVESVRHTAFAPVPTDFIAFDPLKNCASAINVIFSSSLLLLSLVHSNPSPFKEFYHAYYLSSLEEALMVVNTLPLNYILVNY